MRAAVFHGPNQPLAVSEIRDPEPAAGEVLVRVAACGVCHTDLHYIDHAICCRVDGCSYYRGEVDAGMHLLYFINRMDPHTES